MDHIDNPTAEDIWTLLVGDAGYIDYDGELEIEKVTKTTGTMSATVKIDGSEFTVIIMKMVKEER